MQQKQQNMNINIDSSVKPLYADEVGVTCTIKQEKSEKGIVRKEGTVSLTFWDALGQGVVTRVTLTKTTAKALAGVLKTNVDELEKNIDSKEEIANFNNLGETKSSGYIG